MVQTRPGAANSEWLNFIKECSAEHHARKNASICADRARKAEAVPKDKQDKQHKQDKLEMKREPCDHATAVRIKSTHGTPPGLPVEKKQKHKNELGN